MKKIQILQFTLAASKAGRTTYILNQWKHINKERYQFDFVTFSHNLPFADELINQGCKIYYLSCYPKQNKEQFTKEFNEILQKQYDIIEIHTSAWSDLTVEKIANENRIKKIIIHAHSTGCDKRRAPEEIHNQVKAQITRKTATDFWACSRTAGDWLFGEHIPKEEIRIIPNSIETKKFEYNQMIRTELRKENGLEACFVIGQVGRLAYPKNLEFSLRLIKEVKKLIPRTMLLVIGDGPDSSALKRLAKILEIEDNVRFLGKKSDVENWLQVMDVYIMPSFFEGFPIALLEAQTAGLKCFCSDTISNEVFVTENVKALSTSDINTWIEEIVILERGYERIDMSEIIAAAGYEITDTIKSLEKEYSEGLFSVD